MKLDLFTRRRMEQFVEQHRQSQAQLPTLKDLDQAGFTKQVVSQAIKEKWLKELYVTLTTGAVVKGYKIVRD